MIKFISSLDSSPHNRKNKFAKKFICTQIQLNCEKGVALCKKGQGEKVVKLGVTNHWTRD